MVELGQLEKSHAEFEKRGVRIFAISNDKLADTKEMQAEFPHLTMISDAEQSLAKAVQVIHTGADPHGGDTNAPTTILVDGAGKVRWWFRPDRVLVRLSPAQLLAAVDEQLR